MKEVFIRALCVIGGILIGAIGHFVYAKIRYPYGKVKAKKFELLEDEM